MRPSALIAFVLLALDGAAQAAPGVFKWVDKDGIIHYDDITSGGERLTREYLDKREIPDQPEWAGAIPGEFVAAVVERCELNRERLANYRAASSLYGRDPSGNTYPLSKTQAKLMIAETERETAYFCSDNAARRIYTERQASARNAPPGGAATTR